MRVLVPQRDSRSQFYRIHLTLNVAVCDVELPYLPSSEIVHLV